MQYGLVDPQDYIPEAEVLQVWPMLTAKQLRRARKNDQIQFWAFPSGPHYVAEQVQDYIDRVYLKGCPCADQHENQSTSTAASPQQRPTTASSSVGSISTGPIPIAEASSTLANMTPELLASGASLLKQQIGKKPKANSPRSFSQRPPRPKVPSLALIKS